ncbi:MAG TPA: DUF418 domain-containing protein [Haliscomenobacter sp.]|uniref:DUF418 domain-containing protein n=1 Tax=Haliscomenobacter sp. TaxID=2717303 RepID=UPI002B7C4625|nr:DUF418 domain-containing protein [Haliscomenobacter sp.]HOY19019.1 DUF418 domain-containing protein [Haliscomenobacter sp.]HPH20565.1 DUF418 domain-containing protein [Haliscomenobacter sp.]
MPETTQTMIIAAPIAENQRIDTIDILRGFALLGILLMNIPGFSMADYSFEAFKNDPGSFNFWLYQIIGIFFEGKMRAMFGMVFGAGVLLFIANKGTKGASVHALYYRRMFWLLLFGLIHAHLILWIGEILYLYAVCGMILYLFRNVAAKYLVWAVPIVAIVSFVAGTIQYQNIRAKRIAYVEATTAQGQNQTLTATQTKALTEWRKIEKTMIPNREDAKENTRKMKSDYGTVARYLRPLAWDGQTKYLPFEVWDSLALMLLGLALFKWGFLTGSWSTKDYWTVLKIGYGLGLPLVMYSNYYAFHHFSTLEANLARMEQVPINWINLIYPFQRILIVLGHASALILLAKSGVAQGLCRRLAAVGRMALSNYISHSLICTLFFFGYGLNYYAELEFYQIYFVVLVIWAIQLIISPIWLKYFLFGPLEWLWRSLTYWKLQPMRR